MKRFALVVAAGVLSSLVVAAPAVAEPSDGCDTGQVSPSTGPIPGSAIGFGVDARGSVFSVQSVRLCYAALEASGNKFDQYTGSVYVKVSPTGALFVIAVDGDSTNTETHKCADGFLATRGDSSGVHLYGAPDGDFTEATSSRPPNQILVDYANGCR